MCAPPDLKKWQEPCFGLNERLSKPKDVGIQRFVSRDPIGLRGGTNLYGYSGNNPVNNVDRYGLHPSCSVTFVEGTGITGLDTSGIDRIRNHQTNASSDELVRALEEEPDLLIFTGHNRRRTGGKLRLRDGDFGVDEILAKAKQLPRCVFFNACNTYDRAPKQGEYPDTMIITVDRFVNMKAALQQSKDAAVLLHGPRPIRLLRRDPVPYKDLATGDKLKYNFVVTNNKPENTCSR